MLADLDMAHGKMSDFSEFLSFRFTLVIKRENAILKVIEILWYFLSRGKMSYFVSFP